MTSRHILTLECQDQPGIVSAVATTLFQNRCNIVEAQQFNDADTNAFFMRVVFDAPGEEQAIPKLRENLALSTQHFSMRFRIRLEASRMRVLIMVSQLDHCLRDLLYHARNGELPMDVVAIASNHPRSVHEGLDDGVPYYHFPITRETKPQQEEQVISLVERTGAELVVLARYMQVLSDRLVSALSGRCINIHHSFLPGFKGSKPYHQAYQRGVKIIGATAHYVTSDLDEGPIIAQDVESVSHNDTPDRMVRKGRDIERRVLTRAVSYHLADRVLLNGSKTVVFT